MTVSPCAHQCSWHKLKVLTIVYVDVGHRWVVAIISAVVEYKLNYMQYIQVITVKRRLTKLINDHNNIMHEYYVMIVHIMTSTL